MEQHESTWPKWRALQAFAATVAESMEEADQDRFRKISKLVNECNDQGRWLRVTKHSLSIDGRRTGCEKRNRDPIRAGLILTTWAYSNIVHWHDYEIEVMKVETDEEW